MMAKNYVQEGDVLAFTAGGAAIASGAVVLMGKRIGIALADIAANGTGTVSVTDVWTVAKLATDVVAQGDLLYWDAANSRLTATASGNTLAGFAAAPAGNGATTVNIKING
jgi:predicted RecA/RadA family phage recombinase